MGADIHIFFEFYDEKFKRWFAVRINPKLNISPDGKIQLTTGPNIEILTEESLSDLVNAIAIEEDYIDYEDVGIEHDTNRGYPLFGLLAGVRYKDVKPLVRPRGFPDSSAYFQNKIMYEWLSPDDTTSMHSHTYYRLTELINANTKENREKYCYDRMADIIEPLVQFCAEKEYNTDNFRAIICFDS